LAWRCCRAGEAIPLSARLMAVADVYDALISKRVYKPAFSHEKAVGIILEGSGKHFDPDLIAVFREIEDEFRSIARQFSDHQ
jgi:putative two-component system response regulator